MDTIFKQSISPEGTNVFVLHAYLEISEDLESLISDIKHQFSVPIDYFDVSEDECDEKLVLVEITLTTTREFASHASMVLDFSIERDGVSSCFLMFDGAFGGKESFFDESIFNQIFGATSGLTGPLICLDSRLLQSAEWRSMIRILHDRKR